MQFPLPSSTDFDGQSLSSPAGCALSSPLLSLPSTVITLNLFPYPDSSLLSPSPHPSLGGLFLALHLVSPNLFLSTLFHRRSLHGTYFAVVSLHSHLCPRVYRHMYVSHLPLCAGRCCCLFHPLANHSSVRQSPLHHTPSPTVHRMSLCLWCHWRQ